MKGHFNADVLDMGTDFHTVWSVIFGLIKNVYTYVLIALSIAYFQKRQQHDYGPNCTALFDRIQVKFDFLAFFKYIESSFLNEVKL